MKRNLKTIAKGALFVFLMSALVASAAAEVRTGRVVEKRTDGLNLSALWIDSNLDDWDIHDTVISIHGISNNRTAILLNRLAQEGSYVEFDDGMLNGTQIRRGGANSIVSIDDRCIVDIFSGAMTPEQLSVTFPAAVANCRCGQR